MTLSLVADNTPSTASERQALTLAQRMALGTRLTELREERGLTQLQVARQALGFEVSHAAVSRLERGVLKDVDRDRLEALAVFYGETVAGLLQAIEGREEDKEPHAYKSADNLSVTPGYGKRIWQLRQATGLTQREFVLKLGYSASSAALLRQWEAEEVAPMPATLLHVAVIFEVSAAWLITGERAKPIAPTFAMRMRAMQKLYGLSNRELAAVSGLDISTGTATIARLSRKELQAPDRDRLKAIACALDVPVSWLQPPAPGAEPIAEPESPFADLSWHAQQFLSDMAELFRSNLLSDAEISAMRSRVMKEKMLSLRAKAT